jgi:hypothetical protein
MSHLDWKAVLDAMERGERPSHVDDCEPCRTKWARAESMLHALRPEGQPARDLEFLTRRILASSPESGTSWVLRPRWAWALVVPLFLGGASVLWHLQERSLERQYAAIMEGRIGDAPGGLDGLLPPGWIRGLENWADDWFVSVNDEKGE